MVWTKEMQEKILGCEGASCFVRVVEPGKE